jgi:hypothetical protein
VNALVSSVLLTKYHCLKATYLFSSKEKEKNKAITEEDDGRKWEQHQIH